MTESRATPVDDLLRQAAESVPVPDPELFAVGVAARLRAEQRRSGAARPMEKPKMRRLSRPRRTGALIAGLALGCLVVVVGVAPVRSAVADLLGIDGVHIARVAHLPAPPATARESPSSLTTLLVDPAAALNLGRASTLVEAARIVGFQMRLPTIGAYQQPDAVYVGTPPAGGMAAMVYLPRADRPAVPTGGVVGLLTEFRGHLDAGFFQKLVGAGTTVEAVRVGAADGYWLSGAPHEFFYVNPDGTADAETIRLAANTLVWSAAGITYRFESALPRGPAVALAASMR